MFKRWCRMILERLSLLRLYCELKLEVVVITAMILVLLFSGLLDLLSGWESERLVNLLRTIALFIAVMISLASISINATIETSKLLEERRRRHWARLRKAIVQPLARFVATRWRFRERFKAGCYIPICGMLRLLVVDRGLQAYYDDLRRHDATRGLYCVLERLCGPPRAVCHAGLDAEIERLVKEAFREASVDPQGDVENAVRCALYTATPQVTAYEREEQWLEELKRSITMELANPIPSCAEEGAIGSPLLPRDKAQAVAEKVAEKLSRAKIYEKLRKLYGKLREELNKTLLYETLTDDCPYINPESKKQEEPPKCPEVEDP